MSICMTCKRPFLLTTARRYLTAQCLDCRAAGTLRVGFWSPLLNVDLQDPDDVERWLAE